MLYQNNGIEFSIAADDKSNTDILFADHSKDRRGGHLGHAMVEYESGKILCFYANCNGEPNNGHSGDGWMEFKRSLDGGKTWSEKEFFPIQKLCTI